MLKSLIISGVSLGLLVACNSGSNITTDVQKASLSNNQINLNITATGCKTIGANGGSCSVNVTYSAPLGSSSIGQYLQLQLPNNYTSNILNQCSSGAGQISTMVKNCIITVTSQASTSTAQNAYLYPANSQTNYVRFIVGGGLNGGNPPESAPTVQ